MKIQLTGYTTNGGATYVARVLTAAGFDVLLPGVIFTGEAVPVHVTSDPRLACYTMEQVDAWLASNSSPQGFVVQAESLKINSLLEYCATACGVKLSEQAVKAAHRAPSPYSTALARPSIDLRTCANLASLISVSKEMGYDLGIKAPKAKKKEADGNGNE